MTTPSCVEQKRLLPGAVGDMEVLIECPKSTLTPQAVALICHPHPLQGGTMNNKVTYMLASALRQLGAITVRFNFRGVGHSSGSFDQGIGETDDVLRLAEWAEDYFSPPTLWLAGFSFGSYVALRAHKRLSPSRLILVAPPVQRFDFATLSLGAIPTLVLQGNADQVVEAHSVKTWVAEQNPRPDMIEFPEADHFFHGRLTELRDAVTQWMQTST